MHCLKLILVPCNYIPAFYCAKKKQTCPIVLFPLLAPFLHSKKLSSKSLNLQASILKTKL